MARKTAHFLDEPRPIQLAPCEYVSNLFLMVRESDARKRPRCTRGHLTRGGFWVHFSGNISKIALHPTFYLVMSSPERPEPRCGYGASHGGEPQRRGGQYTLAGGKPQCDGLNLHSRTVNRRRHHNMIEYYYIVHP